MYYKNQSKNCYDELITYYPVFYRDVKEMNAILSIFGRLLDELKNGIEKIIDNSFIDTADEETIAGFEDFLGLGMYGTRTLEERRRLVKSFFIGSGKLSASALKEIISDYTDAEISIIFEPNETDSKNITSGDNILFINFACGKKNILYLSDIQILMSKNIPAHIEYEFDITDNTEQCNTYGGVIMTDTQYIHIAENKGG